MKIAYGKWCKFVAIISFILLVSLFKPGLGQAQVQDNQWTEPYRLSSDGEQTIGAGFLSGMAGTAMVADQYGFVHVFWREGGSRENGTVIQYARFDGETWSEPVDIYATSATTIGMVSSTIDVAGTLHLIWTGSPNVSADETIYYMQAPAHRAMSAQNWSSLVRLDIPAYEARLQVDSKNIFHILYSRTINPEAGIYYIHSEDQGTTWSNPIWLDPDILLDHYPRSLQFALDEADGLHAAWYYSSKVETSGDWVRYAHSLDGGQTWSEPFTIDKVEEGTERQLTFAGPVLAVQGQTVHVIWTGGEFNYRNHRVSSDAGDTWGAPIRILGDLNGQAGDGLTIDSAGRVHFVSQIRFPKGIWHTYWNEDHWAEPSLIYLMGRDSNDELGERINAHDTYPVVRAGNQLVITFLDHTPERQEPLYTMHTTLDNIPSLPIRSTPQLPLLASTPSLQPTPTSSLTAKTRLSEVAASAPRPNVSSPITPLVISAIPVLLLVSGAFVLNFFRKL